MQPNIEENDKLSYLGDVMLPEPITKARWLTDSSIIAATTHGNMYRLQLQRDDQNAWCLKKPTKIYSSEHEVAIWDLAVYSSGQTQDVWLCEDSGKVLHLSFDEKLDVKDVTLVYVSKNLL